MEKMNQTETQAYNWLLKQGYSEKDIVFRRRKTPDFICSDGSKFEVKRLYGKSITFGIKQLESIKQTPDIKILVFVLGEENPRHIFTVRELIGKDVVEGIKINTQNEIHVIVSKKTRDKINRLKQFRDDRYGGIETAQDVIDRLIKDAEKRGRRLGLDVP